MLLLFDPDDGFLADKTFNNVYVLELLFNAGGNLAVFN